jgi:hypothetical protein
MNGADIPLTVEGFTWNKKSKVGIVLALIILLLIKYIRR